MVDNLESIASIIRQDFSAKDAAREKALPLCREAIRYSGNTIRAVLERTRSDLTLAVQQYNLENFNRKESKS